MGNIQIGKYRWTVCALLFFATTVNYLDHQVPSLLKPVLEDRYGWGNGNYADMATVFQFTYAITMLGEAGNFPAAIKTAAEWFPKKEPSLAAGIFNSGANAGGILTPLTVPWLAYCMGQYKFVYHACLWRKQHGEWKLITRQAVKKR